MQKRILPSYRSFLIEEFQRRQKKNPSYSLRAFARDLEVPSSRLSEVLNEKVGLSEDRAEKLAQKLQMGPEEKSFFVDLVRAQHARSATARRAAQERVHYRLERLKILESDQFDLVSDWPHFTLLELLMIESNHESDFLAKRLGLSTEQVRESLALLERLQLIEKHEGKWRRTDQGLTTTVDIPSQAIRNYNRQILHKAEAALEGKPLKERDFSSVVFSMNKADLEYAKRRIARFRRELMNELESKQGRDAVYCLALQFFEMTESV